MKKIILLAFLMVGLTVLAQERNRRPQRNQMEQFTPEQRNQLMLKKLTLELDLNDSQQKDINGIIVDMNSKREARQKAMMETRDKGVKPTRDELFAMRNKMLDEQIATKRKLEKILTPKQFEKWNELKENKMGDFREMRQNRMERQRGNLPPRRG